MKTCPNCGKELPDYVWKCKYCDARFAPPPENVVSQPSAQQGRHASAKRTYNIIVFLALLVALIVGYLFIVAPTVKAPPTAIPTSASTVKAPPTARPASASDSPGYLPLLGHLFVGVKIYYGSQKTYGFEALGGSEDCPSMPSGRGVLVRYPDGTQEWKDRMSLVDFRNYFVKSDDPNAESWKWVDLPGCR